MINQHAFSTLAPPLSAVLSSLHVDLEAELNRYRRNRPLSPQPNDSDDLFADLEDPAFDLNAIEAVQVTAEMPPPVPRNRKLFPAAASPERLSGSLRVASAQVVEDDHLASAIAPTPYLDSSEKLIESFSDVPPMPDPVSSSDFKPQRKTVSLLAGAILGFGGLIAGLGASYLMSNPQMAQHVMNGLRGSAQAVATDPQKPFDPPGPDLSVEEFVDINIDSLSSLHMPQPGLDPQAAPSGLSSSTLPPSPATSTALPPIANQNPNSTLGGIQAAVIPANATYYVTVPFTTEQALSVIRQSVAEAFVRQFKVGSRVQLAAFDDLASAQQFIEKIKAQGISAQVHGPTDE